MDQHSSFLSKDPTCLILFFVFGLYNLRTLQPCFLNLCYFQGIIVLNEATDKIDLYVSKYLQKRTKASILHTGELIS